jgi:uncharacterized protein (TIGR01777 family)
MRVIISGASGFVGERLFEQLESSGAEVIRLVRRAPTDHQRERQWDPARGELDVETISGADAVVNLNGRNISQGRWSQPVKDDLRRSRLDATRTIVDTIARADRPPALLVNASATGYYGDRGDQELDEGTTPGTGFLAELARDWELAATAARSSSTRVVLLRLGMVLGDGGALAKMLTPFKLGFGGPIGNGRQWWPWIAMPDVLGAIEHVMEHAEIDGPVNLVAPEAATSKDFARALGEHLGRPAFLPAPAFAVRAAIGEMADALLLASTKAVPKALQEADYRFRAATLSEAFRSTLG